MLYWSSLVFNSGLERYLNCFPDFILVQRERHILKSIIVRFVWKPFSDKENPRLELICLCMVDFEKEFRL